MVNDLNCEALLGVRTLPLIADAEGADMCQISTAELGRGIEDMILSAKPTTTDADRDSFDTREVAFFDDLRVVTQRYGNSTDSPPDVFELGSA